MEWRKLALEQLALLTGCCSSRAKRSVETRYCEVVGHPADLGLAGSARAAGETAFPPEPMWLSDGLAGPASITRQASRRPFTGDTGFVTAEVAILYMACTAAFREEGRA